jgi:putative transposase
VLGMTVGNSEAEPFWSEFLRSLARRGLRGVKLVVSDAHEGLKLAITKVLGATWQRCRVHFMRNAMAHAAWRMRLGSFSFSANRQMAPASRFSQNTNNINDPSAIRTQPAMSLDIVASI